MRYLIVLFLSALTTFAQAANFVSMHQSAHKIALPPAPGTFNYTFDTKVGFKAQYAPTGVTGCAIGFGTGGCAFPGAGSLSLPEFTGFQMQNQEFKIFIPAGTRSFLFSGYAPQGTQSAFVLRYGKEPTRVAALSGAEYQNAQTSERIDTSFSRLIKEDVDHFVVHDGGGTLRFVGGQLDANRSSTDQGKWLYVRQLSGAALFDYQGAIDVDMPKYAAGYNAITWTTSAFPDPVDAASPGGGGGTTNPPATGTTVTTTVASAAGQALKLDIAMTQSAAEVAANPQISAWVAARIPANGLFYTTDVWFFRKVDGWAQLVLPFPESVAYSSLGTNATSLKFTPSMDLTDTDLRAFNVEIYFGYKTSTGAFVSKGKVWPQ
ncbi:hypothetical protein HNP48_002339 [Acidovorax soli]|jgi:hypothetical protein|uniref:Uncharacterized protein n=1 Tax=Acidovorax soli TaxID=592050 RepID=A0A7X0PDN9_9BURK|nr:hypothetical protein [Acidovorax soli]MBB6559672.1 hypothetical protein [Acidovorax soli]